jgi:hypothetical protein
LPYAIALCNPCGRLRTNRPLSQMQKNAPGKTDLRGNGLQQLTEYSFEAAVFAPGIMSGLVIVVVLWIARKYGEDLAWSTGGNKG